MGTQHLPRVPGVCALVFEDEEEAVRFSLALDRFQERLVSEILTIKRSRTKYGVTHGAEESIEMREHELEFVCKINDRLCQQSHIRGY